METATAGAAAVSLNRIFHPTDFSSASEVAFAHALKLAAHQQGRLTILHNEPHERGEHWSEYPKVRQALERWGFLSPHSHREALNELGLSVAKIAAREGNPVEAALDYLNRHPHDLIVLATHQYDGLERLLHRTVAAPLLRQAGELALFVPAGADGFVAVESGGVNLHSVLIPVDYQPAPQVALEAAFALVTALRCTRAKFTVLHVGEAGAFPPVHVPARAPHGWCKVTKQGAVEAAIRETAHECKADLIVMATAGRHGLLDALRGSTTERIVRTAEVPVLAVPALAPLATPATAPLNGALNGHPAS
jgi:nucleotide-binding universal stress UspA family protein